jgi:hypothetical protein
MFALAREERAEAAAQRDAGEEAGDHDAEGVDAAADDVGQHAGPQDFLKERDGAREQHQGQHQAAAGKVREHGDARPARC